MSRKRSRVEYLTFTCDECDYSPQPFEIYKRPETRTIWAAIQAMRSAGWVVPHNTKKTHLCDVCVKKREARPSGLDSPPVRD